MVTLKGIAYRSGNIEFGREENKWAFARIDSELRSGQEDRIRLNPALAPVELRTFSNQAEHQLPWLASFQRTIQSAESIYLQKHDGYLRFRKAIHQAGNNRRYITLSGQEEVDAFAREFWQRIRYFFATRRDIVRCDISRLITMKPTLECETRPLEVKARLEIGPTNEPVVTFDASGGNAVVQLVDWRSTVKEGEKGRFFPEEHHIELTVNQVHQPFTFLEEMREDFGNYSYSFADKTLRKSFDLLVRKKLLSLEKQEKAS
jgi:hypothetical protein